MLRPGGCYGVIFTKPYTDPDSKIAVVIAYYDAGSDIAGVTTEGVFVEYDGMSCKADGSNIGGGVAYVEP